MESTQLDHYKEIFLTCVEGIMVFQRGKVILANPQCTSLFGYSHEELIGMSVENFIPQSGRIAHEKQRSEYMKAPDTRQMGVGRDLMAVRKDGSTFPVEVSLNPAMMDGEQTIITHIIDISKRKQAEDNLKKSEEQLLRYAAELEKRVHERTEELATTVERLKEANESMKKEVSERIKAENEAQIALSKEKELNELKTRFVSMASHEFRTPLSTILSSASLISKYNAPDTEPKRMKHINRIKGNVSELTNILNDFLSLDKLDDGKMSVTLAEFDVCHMLEEVVSELQIVTKPNQEIILKADIQNCIINSDIQILKQVLTNLVSNAIKYSPEGSDIKLEGNTVKNTIIIKVIDQGIGIPEGDQKHLFQKFFRAHNASHIQGTGLGLNIVSKYLELIGGEISFESVEGKGSTFIVKLNSI
ncbi:sensor histidine kinase [Reichenbachiella versicolor]|uniref:sensor histidine kinase n=1 Tax=Reichenbachiella versicolor TaxID=1821036 RepID=UPI000D6E3A76|nr:PAS domain-containing sensor histidine kinase [Reichenbachiella versicolor]